MASLIVGKDDTLQQQQRQICDLDKVKLEPREYYEVPDFSDIGFTDEMLPIDISSSGNDSGKIILGAEAGEDVTSLAAYPQTLPTLDNLHDATGNESSAALAKNFSTNRFVSQKLVNPTLNDLTDHCRWENRVPPLSGGFLHQIEPPNNNQLEINGDAELPVDFLEPILPEGEMADSIPPDAVPPTLPSGSNGTWAISNRVSKQFWKAGDYDSDQARQRIVVGGMDHVRVHPKFLHSNATSHKWALGAVAELLDNALDEVVNGATFVKVDMIRNPRTGCPMLLIEDDGGGMNPDCMRQCMSLGYSAKSKIANTIGQYGNGFKTSTMRLGADVIVFSCSPPRDGCGPTESIGLLSYTFLIETGQEDIIVPMVDYEVQPFGLRKLMRGSVEDWNKNIQTIRQWSPYSTEVDLLDQFKGMKHRGTRIIVYNLWEDDQGQLELDCDTDPYDIQVRGANRDEKNILMAERFPNSRHYLTYRHSLRSYSSILYLRLPPSFRIFLRGKEVEHHNLADDLMFIQELTYRPQVGPEHALKETNQMKAVVTIGFVKDAKEHIDVQGFNVYHKNRLIKPFWRIWNSAASRGRGIIGILEANFVEPAHDKQGFERTIVLARLEARLLEMQKSYWSKHCHKVGYSNTSAKRNWRAPPKDDRSMDIAISSSLFTRPEQDLHVSSTSAAFPVPLPSQTCEAPHSSSQARQDTEFQVTPDFARSLLSQRHEAYPAVRPELGTQALRIPLAFTRFMQSHIQEPVSTLLTASPMSMAFTRSVRSPTQDVHGVSSQARSEPEVQTPPFPLSFAIPLLPAIHEVHLDPPGTRLEAEERSSGIPSDVSRSLQLELFNPISDTLQVSPEPEVRSPAMTKSLHLQTHEATLDVQGHPIPFVVPRSLRSQTQHIPARAYQTDAISLKVNTREEIDIASSRTGPRHGLNAMTSLTTRPVPLEEVNVSLSRHQTSGKGSILQQKPPAIKRKSLEDLGRMFAKRVVTAERTRNAVNPVGESEHSGPSSTDSEMLSIEESARGPAAHNSQPGSVVEATPIEVTTSTAANTSELNPPAQTLQVEIEKNRQLQACLADTEEKLQLIQKHMEKVLKERDELKVQLVKERKQAELDKQGLQMNLQEALLQIRELEAENSRLRAA